MKTVRITMLALAMTSACASGPALKRIVLDESSRAPGWVNDSRIVWEDGGKIYFKSSQQVRGNERLNACFDVAKLNGKEALISEIQDQVKATLDSHEATLAENAEIILSKSRSSELGGRITGLRFTENYFVRYQVGETERIDCYVLGTISNADYLGIKREIIEKVALADPRVKEAIAQKHINFFGRAEAPEANRGIASDGKE